MSKLPLTIASAALFLTGGVRAQNIWNGSGVTGGTAGTDWTATANYTAAPTFGSATDLKFSTITNAAGGVALTAGTGGTYALRDLYFGDVTASGSGQTAAQFITVNGNGTAGQTILDLNRDIYVPSTGGSIVTLGGDLTLNLSNGSHAVKFQPNSNVTTAAATLVQPILIVNSLITGGGSSAKFVNTYSQYGASGSNSTSPVLILTNNGNSFVAVQNRFDTQVGFTSIANVGGGNSALGNATDAATGTISFGNGGFINYIGTGNQTTDRNLNMASGNTLGNASTGTILTYNGQVAASNAVTLRANVITGGTLVVNSVLADGAGSIAVSKNGSTSYYNASGASATNDGGGTLVLGGNNTFTGAVTVSAGTLRITHANALGSTTGITTVAAGATLDLNGLGLGEAVTMSGTGVGAAGALVNTNTSTQAVLSGNVTLSGSASIGGAGDLKITGNVGESVATRPLTKVGGGTLILNGTNTYTGTTTVSAGTLGGIGSISTGAATFATGTTLNPGDGATTGQFSFGGNLTLSNDAIFSVSLNQSAGNGYDRVAVGGTTTLTGSILSLSLLGGFDASAQTGQTFNILTSTGTLTGQFDQGTSITATSGLYTYDFGISYSGNIVTLTLNTITAVPEPSTWALIAGAVSLGAVVLWRRRRN